MKPYFTDDNVKIYNGDCKEILPQLQLPKKTIIVTDPPYGIKSVDKNGHLLGGSTLNFKAAPPGVYKPVKNDDKKMEIEWLLSYGCRQIIFGADHFEGGIPSGGRIFVWDKLRDFNVDRRKNKMLADCELAWDSQKGCTRLYQHRQFGMFHDGYGDVDRCHPNQKPLAVLMWLFTYIKPDPDCIIVDPYCGSGTTLVAAKQNGFQAIGIEYEKDYCEIAKQRVSQNLLFSSKTIQKNQEQFFYNDESSMVDEPPVITP